MLEFVQEITSKLRDRSYRIKDIVGATGISHGALKRIRDGESVPKLETLLKLKSYFDGFETSKTEKLSDEFSKKGAK